MDTAAKIQQKLADLVAEMSPHLRSHWHYCDDSSDMLGSAKDQFASALLSSGIVHNQNCSGKLCFSVSKFKSAMCINVNADAEVQLLLSPIRHDNFNQLGAE